MNPNVALCVAPLRHPAARRYDADWRRLRGDAHALVHAARWRVVRTDIASLDEVLVAIGYERPRTPLGEANLRRLVELARHDTVAAQVVVRRLLPGALSIATRYRARAGDDTLDELLGALWIVIRTFDPERHPASLAAALLRDAESRAFHGRARRRLREVPSDQLAERASADTHVEPADELADVLAEAAAAGVADHDEITLLRLLASAPSPADVARRLNITERTLRNRRARVTAKLRAAACAA